LLLSLSLAGCAKTDTTTKLEPPHDSVSVVDTLKAKPAPIVFALDTGSPRLVIDSTAKEPTLQFRDGVFTVLLPLDMAGVLADSAPGFTPLKRSAFDKEVIAWMDQYGERMPPSLDAKDSTAIWARALSVVIGDFNGDSKRDVAMEGVTGDAFVLFFLLSASTVNARPALLYFHPPSPGTAQYVKESVIDFLTRVPPGKITGFAEEGESPKLDLHHDAVELSIFGKASEIYYIENGVVQVFTTSD